MNERIIGEIEKLRDKHSKDPDFVRDANEKIAKLRQANLDLIAFEQALETKFDKFLNPASK